MDGTFLRSLFLSFLNIYWILFNLHLNHFLVLFVSFVGNLVGPVYDRLKCSIKMKK